MRTSAAAPLRALLDAAEGETKGGGDHANPIRSRDVSEGVRIATIVSDVIDTPATWE